MLFCDFFNRFTVMGKKRDKKHKFDLFVFLVISAIAPIEIAECGGWKGARVSTNFRKSK